MITCEDAPDGLGSRRVLRRSGFAAVVLASRLGRRWAAVLVAGVIIVELFVLAPFDIYAKRADPFLTPGWMPLVRAAQGRSDSRVFALDAKLYPNTAGALGLQDIRVLDALYVERYWRYVRTFIQPDVFDRFTGATELPRFRDNPMFDALGVRAVLSEQDLADVPGFASSAETAHPRLREHQRVSTGVGRARRPCRRNEDEAFEFLEAHARRKDDAFIVDSFDPRREAVVETAGRPRTTRCAALQGGRDECTASDSDRATIQHYSGDSVSVRVEAACPGLLVLPDTYFPGWKATVNGRQAPIYATDGAFRGVPVPEGTSRVEFRDEPRTLPDRDRSCDWPGSPHLHLFGCCWDSRGRTRIAAGALQLSDEHPCPIHRLAA